MSGRLRTLAERRRTDLLIIALGVILSLPGVWTGFQWDDHLFRLVLLDAERMPLLQRAREEWSLTPPGSGGKEWALLSQNPSKRNHELADVGLLPWWTAAEFRVDFLRPASWLSHAIDFKLWPNGPAAMHAHSLLWFAALIALACAIYRTLFGSAVAAALAGLLFALDDMHALPTYFIGNRHALMGGVFGLLTFWAHLRWRRDGWRSGGFLAPLSLALGLWSYEVAIAAVGFILCYELFLENGPLPRRLVMVLPSVAVVLVWRITYVALGLAVVASEIYVDLARAPLRIFSVVLLKAPVLLSSQLFSPPADFFAFLPARYAALVWTADTIFLVAVAFVLLPWLRRDRLARFWAASAILAVVPLCATMPNDRLLVLVGFAAMGLVAMFLLQFPAEAPSLSRLRRATGRTIWVIFIVAHLVFAPVMRVVRGMAFATSSRTFERSALTAPLPADPSRRSLVIVNAPLAPLNLYFLAIRVIEGKGVPARTLPLASGVLGLEITRTDSQTLTLRPDTGFLSHPLDRLLRDHDHPMFEGQRIELTDATITVHRVDDRGHPAEAIVHFRTPLEDRQRDWLQWRNGRYEPFAPPAVGETVRLDAVALPVLASPALSKE